MTILTMIIANDSLRRARDVDRDPQNHWNRFRGNFGETERRGEAHIGFSERINTILNSTELTVATRQKSMKQFRHLDFFLFSSFFLFFKNKQTNKKRANKNQMHTTYFTQRTVIRMGVGGRRVAAISLFLTS